MTGKEYLLQARYLDERIHSKIQQIESLNDLATSCSAVISDMPRNPNQGGSKMADAVIKIVTLQEEINQDINALVDLKHEIMGVIKAVPNVEYQTLLEKRYLCFITWEQIAVDMGYELRYIHKLHGKALEEVQIPDSCKLDIK